MSPNETDEDWLCRHHPRATEDEIEAFSERVAIKMADGYAELTARAESLVEMRRSGKWHQG